MPDCHLEHVEAEDIASYLLREQKAAAEIFQPDAALAARGKKLFAQHRCDACHRMGEKVAPPALPALSKVRADEGCLSEERGPWPHYPLSDDAARGGANGARGGGERRGSRRRMVQLTLTRLNCLACHQRDGLGGVAGNRSEYFTGREESLGEQGRIPPPLTGVGAKLKAAWLREVVANGAGVRPSLHTRMPKFGTANAEPLVAGSSSSTRCRR